MLPWGCCQRCWACGAAGLLFACMARGRACLGTHAHERQLNASRASLLASADLTPTGDRAARRCSHSAHLAACASERRLRIRPDAESEPPRAGASGAEERRASQLEREACGGQPNAPPWAVALSQAWQPASARRPPACVAHRGGAQGEASQPAWRRSRGRGDHLHAQDAACRFALGGSGRDEQRRGQRGRGALAPWRLRGLCGPMRYAAPCSSHHAGCRPSAPNLAHWQHLFDRLATRRAPAPLAVQHGARVLQLGHLVRLLPRYLQRVVTTKRRARKPR